LQTHYVVHIVIVVLIALGWTSIQDKFNFWREEFLNVVKGSQGVKNKDIQKLKSTPRVFHSTIVPNFNLIGPFWLL